MMNGSPSRRTSMRYRPSICTPVLMFIWTCWYSPAPFSAWSMRATAMRFFRSTRSIFPTRIWVLSSRTSRTEYIRSMYAWAVWGRAARITVQRILFMGCFPSASVSVLDPELLELAGRRLIPRLEVLDPGRARPLLELLQQLLDAIFGPLDHRFHPAVGEVLHEPLHSQLPGLPFGVGPESHPLHAAAEVEVDPARAGRDLTLEGADDHRHRLAGRRKRLHVDPVEVLVTGLRAGVLEEGRGIAEVEADDAA